MKKILIALMLLANVAKGQIATYYLDKDFGLAWNSAARDIGSKMPISQAKATYYAFYARWIAEGQADPANFPNQTDDQFLKLSEHVCDWNEAIWRGHAAGHVGSDGKLIPCQSRSNIHDPAGQYWNDYPCLMAFGNYYGHGTSRFYYGGTIPQGGTEIRLDYGGWLGKGNERIVFRGATWGREDLSSYQEAFTMQGFRVVGDGGDNPGTYNAAINCSGLAIWDAGSVSHLRDLFIENFGTAAIYSVRGTPLTCDNLTIFRNGFAGVLLEGGGSWNFDGTMEFDENPSMFYSRAGHGRPGWGSLCVDHVKSETGPAPGRPVGVGQAVLVSEDGIDAHFGKIDYAAVGIIPHTMFYVNAKVNASFVKADMIHLFGPCYGLMQDAANGKLWKFTAPGGLNQNGYWATPTKDFAWTNIGGGQLKCSFDAPAQVTVAKNRLAPLPIDPMTGAPVGSWNDAAGTPAYPYGGGSTPAPPTCTWVLGTETCGTCTNNVQTCTTPYVSSVSGCTPSGTKPADQTRTQTCGTTPPPSGALYTASGLSNTDAGARTPINVPGVKRAVFTNINWSKGGPTNYPYLLGIGTGTQALKAMPNDGSLWIETGTPSITASGKLVGGVATTITVVFSSPVTITSIYNRSGSYDAFKGTIGKLELFAN